MNRRIKQRQRQQRGIRAMNFEKWQRQEKIEAEAEAAAKRSVERILADQPCFIGFDPGVDITNTLADAIAHGDGMMQVTENGVRHIPYEQTLKDGEE